MLFFWSDVDRFDGARQIPAEDNKTASGHFSLSRGRDWARMGIRNGTSGPLRGLRVVADLSLQYPADARSILCGRGPKRVPSAAARRQALAPLELVLALPIILCVFALILNAGYAGMWKIRGLGAARQAAWSNRSPRTALKTPSYWQEFWRRPSPTSHTEGLPDLMQTFTAKQRGPFQEAEIPGIRRSSGNLPVDENLLEPTRDVFQGHFDTTRKFPLLPDGLGSLNYKLDHPLLENSLYHHKTRLHKNIQRRTKALYRDETRPIEGDLSWNDTALLPEGLGAGSSEDVLPREKGSEWVGYVGSEDRAMALLKSSNLVPLNWPNIHDGRNPQGYHDPETPRSDHDPDVERLKWGGKVPPTPGFMPPLGSFRDANYERVYENKVAPLIEKIHDDPDFKGDEGDVSLPYTLADKYINLFEKAITIYQPTAGTPELAEQLRMARENELRPKIEELKRFQEKF
jgi:hypothetical protein